TILEDGEAPGPEPQDDMNAYYNAKSEAQEHLRNSKLDCTAVGPSARTLEEPTGHLTVDNSGANRDVEVTATGRANVAAVIAATLEEPASIGTVLSLHDGHTPLAHAVAQGN